MKLAYASIHAYVVYESYICTWYVGFATIILSYHCLFVCSDSLHAVTDMIERAGTQFNRTHMRLVYGTGAPPLFLSSTPSILHNIKKWANFWHFILHTVLIIGVTNVRCSCFNWFISMNGFIMPCFFECVLHLINRDDDSPQSHSNFAKNRKQGVLVN